MKLLKTVLLLLLNTSFLFGQIIFEDTFEAGNFKAAWQLNTNLSGTNGMILTENGIGINNTVGAKIGKSGDSNTFTTNALDLHLDLSEKVAVEMTFLIADLWDEAQAEEGLYFSDDGGNAFVKVVDFFPDKWCNDKYGQYPPIDITGLAKKHNLNLTSTFVIRFQQTGEKDFKGGSSGNSDGFLLDNVVVYDPQLRYAKLPFEDNFDTEVFDKAWAWNFADNTSTEDGITSPMNYVGIRKAEGLEGTAGVYLGRVCDGESTTNALDLHLDLSEEKDVEMTFFIAGLWDESQLGEGLYFSDNGGHTFVKVLDFFPSQWCSDKYGQHPPIDVDGLARKNNLQLTNEFVVRFQQTGDKDFKGRSPSNSDGFLLDNVRVYDPQLTYAKLPFEDDFNTGTWNTAWAWNFADNTSTISVDNNEITSPMNYVGINNQDGYLGTAGVAMGRICDGVNTTNALDLHLDLSEEVEVEMTFLIADLWDESQDEGLYFSDNGGRTFVKVLDFFPNEWCNDKYGQHPPIDVDGLARKNNLYLTNQFVIRFQETGENDFKGRSSSSSDGFLLDNVRVYKPNLQYTELPFEDNFESGTFKDAWAWRFADATSSIGSDFSITSPMSVVEVQEGVGRDGTYGVAIGRRCDGAFSTNALDLHLDLLNQVNVELLFWLSDSYDDTDNDDGVYLSNNGGINFTKIYDFDFSMRRNNLYEQYKLNISNLAALNFVELTEKSIIRIQQRGENDFSGNATINEDGFYLDEIMVHSRETITSTRTIEEDNQLSVFPVPSKDLLHIQVQQLLQSIDLIEIHNLQGKSLLRYENHKEEAMPTINISSLPVGLYYLSVIFENQEKVTKKIIKK